MGIFKAPKITTSDRTSLVLDDGEIVYDTDLQKFFKGDGTTSGGISMEGAAWGGITGTLSAQSDLNTALGNKENTIASGTTGQYWRGDKSWQTLDKSAVGLGNVPNLDTSNPANITQNSTHRFVTDTEKSTWNGKQDSLVSGTNIKTVNGNSLLGTGDLTITGGLSQQQIEGLI